MTLSEFPICKLHRQAIVERLPDHCPLGGERVFQAVGFFQDRGYLRLGQRPQDLRGLRDLERYKTCYQCIDRLIAHPVVRELRQKQRTGPARTKTKRPRRGLCKREVT